MGYFLLLITIHVHIKLAKTKRPWHCGHCGQAGAPKHSRHVSKRGNIDDRRLEFGEKPELNDFCEDMKVSIVMGIALNP